MAELERTDHAGAERRARFAPHGERHENAQGRGNSGHPCSGPMGAPGHRRRNTVSQLQHTTQLSQRPRATCHRGLLLTPCVIVSPSSYIWDTTLFLMGLLSLVSAILFYGATRKKGFSILFGIFGLGALIAGAVPETLLSVHELASNASFLGGSTAAIVAFWFLKSPLKYLSVALGLFSFASLIPLTFEGPFFRWNGIFGLGLGGIERMVVYPIVIWEIAFGAYLMSGALSTSRGEEAKPTE